MQNHFNVCISIDYESLSICYLYKSKCANDLYQMLHTFELSKGHRSSPYHQSSQCCQSIPKTPFSNFFYIGRRIPNKLAIIIIGYSTKILCILSVFSIYSKYSLIIRWYDALFYLKRANGMMHWPPLHADRTILRIRHLQYERRLRL